MFQRATLSLTLLLLSSVCLWSQESSAVTNLGLATDDAAALSGKWLAFQVFEECQREDLNGDGDMTDGVLHVRDLEAGETTNLGFAGGVDALSGKWLAFTVREASQRQDLNGDGDMADTVLHVRDLEVGETTNLRLAGENRALSGKWLAFRVFEVSQREDLNGDGDMEDRVPHVRDLEIGETTNLRLTCCFSALSGRWLAFTVFEEDQGEDLNGDGDMEDSVLHVTDLSAFSTLPRFLRGDCNADGTTAGVTDALFLVGFNFLGREEPRCRAACDADADGDTGGVTDAVYLLSFYFLGTPPPPAPFFRCGRSISERDRALGCQTPQECP